MESFVFAPKHADLIDGRESKRERQALEQQEKREEREADRRSGHPSRLVALLGNLEKQGFVERRANPNDRRLYSLHLTKDRGKALERIGKVAREHQEALLSTLTREERDTLATLLQRIADQQGLVRRIHPDIKGWEDPSARRRMIRKRTAVRPSTSLTLGPVAPFEPLVP